ncbi:MAG: class I SAM-dependent methyltransferase [Promethearchaeota archaeon]
MKEENTKSKIYQEILDKEAFFWDANINYDYRSKSSIFYKNNKEVLEYFNKALEGMSGRILVLGCGVSDITNFLNKGFKEVIGIDISPKSIEKVNEKIKATGLEQRAKAFIMDAHNLQFGNGYFDIVIGNSILHHLDIEKATSEINRVVKNDGKILFVEPLGLNPIINWYRKRTPEIRTESEHPLKPRDFKIIQKYFSIIDSQGFYLLTILSFVFKTFIKSNMLYKISRYLFVKADRVLISISAFLKYLCWIIVINGIKKWK